MATGNWIVYAAVTLLLWGFWGFFYKVAGQQISYYNVLFYGIAGAVVANVFVLLYIGMPDVSASMGRYAFLGGFVGALGLLSFVAALELQDASIVAPVTALYPVITAVLAYVVLQEPITLQKLMGIVLAAVAMVLLAL